MQEQAAKPRGEFSRNWPLLMAATAGLSFGAIPTATLGIFMQPLQDAFGWTRATTTLGLTVFALASTLLAPFGGALVDRFGSRAVAIPGLALSGLSFAAFAFVGGSVALWITIWTVYSLCALGIRSTVWNPAVSGAFVTNRGISIAVMLSGMSVAGALAPLIAHNLITGFGWEGAFIALGLGWAGIAWILVLLFFRERFDAPADPEVPPIKAVHGGLTLREAARNPAILRIAFAVLIQTSVAAAVGVHLVPILTSFGPSRGEAAGMAVFMGLGAVMAKFAAGAIADRVRSPVLPLAAFTFPVIAYLMLLYGDGSIALLSAATFIIGSGSGAAIHIIIYLTTQYGGLLNFGKIYGSISALMGLAAGIGPFAAAWVYDATGSYSLFFMAAIPGLIVAGLAVFGLGPFPDFKPGTSHAEPLEA